jgi:hypothetical protein
MCILGVAYNWLLFTIIKFAQQILPLIPQYQISSEFSQYADWQAEGQKLPRHKQ